MKISLIPTAVFKGTIKIDVKHEDIATKSVVVYDNKFYMFRGFEGSCFDSAKFVEIEPPLYLNKQE